ncbi:MraY family glycosyltransferase [Sediminitomix flava]|uniref:UDP-N-acetylmuramyl pentapeptide phosphotransferase/UDP-N-acetylglucosamine-1-phosphate transferase n=1 Tax=Sediminitomix flava TaxID=379075 RepID=A0A315Z5W6_SEDFL|nr:MraY family glycosyltransferase [Sediminitomix flava]PWJ39247.1 UDP-N-acetylmuramyl pentapeptide phosphotransferase/UDP-N-acetylglucosamine-1-phosphate transferase [Sediminitomix flava]
MNTIPTMLGFTVCVVLLSFVLTQVVIKQALKYNIVDKPRADRFHTKTTALMGGIAIMLAFICSLTFFNIVPVGWGVISFVMLSTTVYFLFNQQNKKAHIMAVITVLSSVISIIFLYPETYLDQEILWLLTGAEIIFLTGAFDDKSKAMEPKVKLFFQILVATIALVFVGPVGFLPAPLNYIFSLFWIVGLMNAYNMIDNMNGLSTGVACIGAFFIFGIAGFYYQMESWSMIALILGAVLLGFIPNNYPSAKIFMGDSGSMLLGFLIATISMKASWMATDSASWELALPIGLAAYPIFDVTLVSINRTRSGRPVYVGGKDHSSHLLVKYGFSPKNAVLIIYGIVALTASLTFMACIVTDIYAVFSLLTVIGVLLAVGLSLTKLHDQEYMPEGKKPKKETNSSSQRDKVLSR